MSEAKVSRRAIKKMTKRKQQEESVQIQLLESKKNPFFV
jgi:hypothetical protein